jgi:hypothetical protein
MASKSVENRECPKCGELVRPRSLFCYKCGENVAEESSVKVRRKESKDVSDIWFKDSIVKENDEDLKKASEEAVSDAFEKKEVKEKKDTKLKSAATMRDKAKTVKKQKVEMVWDTPDNPSSISFFIVSFILIALVIGLMAVAWILR